MNFLKILFSIILFGIAVVSSLPHVFPNFWFTDIFSHFKLQYVIILIFFLLPVLFYSIEKKTIPIVLILILVIWNSWFIAPLYIQDKNIVENPGESLSILSLNLLASNTNYTGAMELIREKDPDVVVLQELSPQWELRLKDLYSQYPYRLMVPQSNNFGIGILSKTFMNSQVTDLGKVFPPSIFSEILKNNNTVSILATHPVPPVGRDRFEFRNEQLKEIGRLSARESGNFIVAGDLNSSSYSVHFQDLVKKGNLKDSRKGYGIASSWPADIFIMRTTLDHILYKGEMRVLSRTTERNIGSDHLPVYIEIGL